MFPASAGMILGISNALIVVISVPRIRGDDPASFLRRPLLLLCSPHPRG